MGLSGSQMALMQARSGLARSAATRSDYYIGGIAMTIGGVSRGATIEKDTTSIENLLNEQPDTATLQVFGFSPSVGQEIIMGSGAISNRIFAGTIVRAEQLSVKKAALNRWRIEATDYTWLLNKVLVTAQYPAQSASLIVIDLMAQWAPTFTTANVVGGAPSTPDVFTIKAERLFDVITRLGNLVGWHTYPDYNKDLHFFSTETSQAPLDITESNFAYENFLWQPTIDQIRTRVFVEGGGGGTTAPVATGATTLPVDECGWYSGSGGTIVSGSNLVTYTGRSASSGPGNLTGVPATGAGSVLYPIKQGDGVNIWVQRDDLVAQAALAALEGGDGIHQYYIQDQTLSINACQARGDAELVLFSTIDYTGSYETRDKFSRAGKSVVVNLPTRGISATILLQKVRRYYEATGRWTFECSFQRIRRDFFDILRQLQQGNPSS